MPMRDAEGLNSRNDCVRISLVHSGNQCINPTIDADKGRGVPSLANLTHYSPYSWGIGTGRSDTCYES